MNNIRKKIIALTLAGTMITSLTGCNKLDAKLNETTKQYELTGKISKNSLKDSYYIVEIITIDDKSELYLGKGYYSSVIDDIYTKNELTIMDKGFKSDYGYVNAIYDILPFITYYGEDKKEYTAEEIVEIFELIKKDYSNIKNNDSIKKLNKNK